MGVSGHPRLTPLAKEPNRGPTRDTAMWLVGDILQPIERVRAHDLNMKLKLLTPEGILLPTGPIQRTSTP